MMRTVLLGIALIPIVHAQVALGLEDRDVRPFEPTSYDNGEYRVHLEPGDYWFTYNNEGMLDGEYWLKDPGGNTVRHNNACCHGGTRFNTTSAGEFTVQFNGQGRFAIMLASPIDTVTRNSTYVLHGANGLVAFAASMPVSLMHLCMTADSAFVWRALTPGYGELASGTSDGNKAYGSVEPDVYFVNVFVEGVEGLNITISDVDCRVGANPPGPAAGVRDTSVPVGAWVALLGVAIALSRRSTI